MGAGGIPGTTVISNGAITGVGKGGGGMFSSRSGVGEAGNGISSRGVRVTGEKQGGVEGVAAVLSIQCFLLATTADLLYSQWTM